MIQETSFGVFNGILGSLGDLSSKLTPAGVHTQFEYIVSTALAVLTVSAGLWFIFQIFGGALGWLASGGEKQALQNAQKRIVNSVIGLLIVVMAYTFIAIVGGLVGLYILSPFDALQGKQSDQIPGPAGTISTPGPCEGGHRGVDCP